MVRAIPIMSNRTGHFISENILSVHMMNMVLKYPLKLGPQHIISNDQNHVHRT
jgi:hypothetical protein